MKGSIRVGRVLASVALALSLAACRGAAPAGGRVIYVDGTRGCKEPAKEVALWSEPGAAAVGAQVVAQAPHGYRAEPLETASQYGVTFYLIELEGGQRGWLPINYSETILPVCD